MFPCLTLNRWTRKAPLCVRVFPGLSPPRQSGTTSSLWTLPASLESRLSPVCRPSSCLRDPLALLRCLPFPRFLVLRLAQPRTLLLPVLLLAQRSMPLLLLLPVLLLAQRSMPLLLLVLLLAQRRTFVSSPRLADRPLPTFPHPLFPHPPEVPVTQPGVSTGTGEQVPLGRVPVQRLLPRSPM